MCMLPLHSRSCSRCLLCLSLASCDLAHCLRQGQEVTSCAGHASMTSLCDLKLACLSHASSCLTALIVTAVLVGGGKLYQPLDIQLTEVIMALSCKDQRLYRNCGHICSDAVSPGLSLAR